MKITKIGHCCLLIEENGLRILTDPGMYSTGQDDLENIDLILITHEHQDHIHLDSLKAVIKHNPNVRIITNKAVAKLLDQEKIPYDLLQDQEATTINDVEIEAYEVAHAMIYETLPRVRNTGFFIAEKFFYPGDALINPKKPVDILAFPIAGPWIKFSEAIDYVKEVNPKTCFPVHDAVLIDGSRNFLSGQAERVLKEENIKVIIPEVGKEFNS